MTQPVDFDERDGRCPVHRTPHRKMYTYGSTLSAETEVFTFCGCRCAVSVRHDPVGTFQPLVRHHHTFEDAAGTGRLHAMPAAAKYR